MAYEDFTTYDEIDGGNVVTVATNKVSWNVLQTRSETSHLSDSKGAAHFSGDFEHLFECQFSTRVNAPICGYWGIANAQIDMKALIDAGADAVHFFQSIATLFLRILENGSPVDDTWLGSDSTTYYITLARDDDGGANNTGQYTAEIRTTSHSGTLQDTLTVDCSAGEQNDFEYIFALSSYDDGTPNAKTDGFTENLDLQEAPPVGTAGIMTTNSGFWGPTF